MTRALRDAAYPFTAHPTVLPRFAGTSGAAIISNSVLSVTMRKWKMQYVRCWTNPEGAVRLNGTDEIAFHRVPFIAAATTIVMVALLSHFPYYSATID